MSWVLFALLSAFLFAVANVVDKYILTKWVKNPAIPVIVLSFVGLVVSLFVFLVHHSSLLSVFNTILALIAGVLFVAAVVLYFKAVSIEEISRVVPLVYLSPLFILILGAILLGELFTPWKYFGIVLLVSGAVLMTLRNLKELKPGRAFWIMLIASFALAVNAIITKYLLSFADFWTIFSYERVGAFIGAVPLILLNFHDLVATVKKHGKRVVAVISLNELLNLVGVLFLILATAKGFVTLVNALSSVQPFFVLLISLALTVRYPHIIREEFTARMLALKVMAVAMIFTGAILIT